MIIRPLLFAAALLMPSAVFAQSSDELSFDLGAQEATSLEGSWAMQIDETTIFRFDIVQDGAKWSGTWLRPDSFASDGNAFARLKGPVERIPSMAGLYFAGLVELSFDDPRPGAIPDIFRFRLMGKDVAELSYVGTDLAPYDLVRVDGASVMGGWNEAAVYRRPEEETGFGDIEILDADDIVIPETNSDSEPEAEPERPRIEADFLEGI